MHPCHFLCAQAADEEALPFKMCYALSHELHLRLFIFPESTHCLWNNVRNSIRRTGLQHCLLLASILSNAAHGPFTGGRNFQTLQESAEDLASMGRDDFNALVDGMMQDRQCQADDENIPQTAADIVNLPAVRNLPPFVVSSAFLR